MLGKVFTGAIIVVSMRWIDRLLGLFSTLLLARLLTPADFGIVAMASVVVGLIDVFLDLGVVAVLVHKRECDDEDYNTAWTIRLLEALVVAFLIVVTSPLAAEFFHDERVAPVLQLMAIGIMVSGFQNIGVDAFQKDLQFGKDFQFFFLRRVIGFAATLVLALSLKTYWALPLGALAGRIGGVAVSYMLHPFRPRLSLSRFSNFWSFSQWMLVRSIGDYLGSRLDKFLVGHRADAAAVGAYSLADEVSTMPTSELLMPIGRVLFPAFVQVRDKPDALRHAYLLALAVQAMVAIPAATGLALIAHDAVALMLGEQWMNAVPFVQVLAFVYGLNAFTHGAGFLLLTLGKVRILAISVWLQIAVFALGAVTLLANSEALALAQWRLAVTGAYALAFVTLVLTLVPGLRARDFLAVVWRPLIGAGVMAALLPQLALAGWPLVPALLVRCAVGAAIYSTTLLFLWAIAGRPGGAETYILEKLAIILRRPSMAPGTPK